MRAGTLIKLRLLFGVAWCVTAGASAQLLPSSASVSLSSFGLATLDSVRYTEVSLVHGRAGTQLIVSNILERPPQLARPARGSRTVATEDGVMLVAPFDGENRNHLGGAFNPFSRSPSRAQVRYAATPDGRRGLALSFRKVEDGYCGLWIHLLPTGIAPSQREYLNVSEFQYLSFFIRGDRPVASLRLKVADARLFELEDALLVGRLDRFVEGGRIDTAWRRVVVPLAMLPGALDRRRLGTIVLESGTPDSATVWISTLGFSRDTLNLPPLPPTVPIAAQKPILPAAVWVWNTASLIQQNGELEKLLAFLDSTRLAVVYLALPHEGSDRFGGIRFDRDAYRTILRAIRARGAAIHASIGDPGLIRPEKRRFLEETIDNIGAYNRSVPEEDRFDGLHVDIEPYLIPGFSGPFQQKIVREFWEALQAIAGFAHRAGLECGAALPFWFDAADERTGQPVMVETEGRRRPLYEAVIDLMDEVALMCYRTSAFGADGVIWHAESELAYAASKEKRVYVGLELAPVMDETALTFQGEPRRSLPDNAGVDFILAAQGVGDSVRLTVVAAEDFARWKSEHSSSAFLFWTSPRVLRIEAEKISFARSGRGRMLEVMQDAWPNLSAYRSFAGYAVHHYGVWDIGDR